METSPRSPAVDGLAAACRGPVLRPDDPAWDDARRVWNAMVDRRPALIVRCSGAADVARAVNFARENGLLLAVRGGGHNIAGTAVCDDGLVVDLSPMRGIRVDPDRRTVRVQGGATWGDVDHETQLFGLAVPGGVVSTTGVGGLTLGGGMGWLSRAHGLTVDNLLSVDVVTAAGEIVTADEERNRDLFWAVRGGGGNFGVVTSFEFAAHPVGPEVLFGPTVYRHEDAPEVLRHYRSFAADAQDACCVWVDSLFAPPLPFLPESVHGTRVLSVMAFHAGPVEAGRRALAPLLEFGEPVGEAVRPTPYTAAQSTLDPLFEPGLRNYWKSHNFVELSDATVDTVVAFGRRLPTARSDILIHQVGGAINRVAPGATAYPHRDARFVITPGARWDDPSDDERCIAWVRGWHAAAAPGATGGAYANFIPDEDGADEAYGQNYVRLAEVKDRWDPTNLFRLNQNVRPTAGGAGGAPTSRRTPSRPA